MTTGVRELKAQLSRYLKHVQSGAIVTVTDHGRVIATIQPVETPPQIEWAHRMVAEGLMKWTGGKPRGAARPIRLRPGKLASEMIIEDREDRV